MQCKITMQLRFRCNKKYTKQYKIKQYKKGGIPITPSALAFRRVCRGERAPLSTQCLESVGYLCLWNLALATPQVNFKEQ